MCVRGLPNSFLEDYNGWTILGEWLMEHCRAVLAVPEDESAAGDSFAAMQQQRREHSSHVAVIWGIVTVRVCE